MPSPYDLFEATREAVDAFMAAEVWPATPLERAFATREAQIANETLLKIGSRDQPKPAQSEDV